MNCHRIGTLVGAALMIGFGCKTASKTADPQATPDAAVEMVPAIPAPAPPPPPVVDAALESVDALADTAGVAPPKSGKMKSAAQPPKPGGGTGGRGITTLQVTGNLQKTVADEVLRAKVASFASCHDGGEHGQVQIKVTMNDRGVVEIAKVIKKSALGGAETELCLARVAGRFKFPPPPGGGEATVTFQLKF